MRFRSACVVALAVSVGVPLVGPTEPEAIGAKRTTTRKASTKRPRATVPVSKPPTSTASTLRSTLPSTLPSTVPSTVLSTNPSPNLSAAPNELPLPLPSLLVSTRTTTFVDTSRATAATSASTAKSSRTLVTLIVAPTDTTRRYPLFVFAHGLGGHPAQYEQLLRRISAAGYVVAAPTFPLSNTAAPGGPSFFDEPNQPADMSFVITAMLSDPQVDADTVFVGGHSLGGITTVDLIGNASLIDRRIDAAIVIAGTANLFGTTKLFQNTPAIPVLFMHGDADSTVPIALGRSAYLSALAPKWFMTVLGGNHVFGIDRRPDLAVESGLAYTDTMSVFLTVVSTPVGSTSAGDNIAAVTKALQSVVAGRSNRLSLQSAV